MHASVYMKYKVVAQEKKVGPIVLSLPIYANTFPDILWDDIDNGLLDKELMLHIKQIYKEISHCLCLPWTEYYSHNNKNWSFVSYAYLTFPGTFNLILLDNVL